MVGDIRYKAEVELAGDIYVAYLKEVATKSGKIGTMGTTIKAFIKKK